MPRRLAAHPGNLETLFLRLEELVLASSGEDDFEEVFKLVIAKLWDEQRGARQFRKKKTPEATAQSVTLLLQEASVGWPGVLFEPTMRLRPGHVAVCVEALEKQSLSGESFEVLDGFFEFLVGRAAKGAKGQFFTPRHVVELCVRMCKPRPFEVVMDPACGSGGFLVHAFQHACGDIPYSDRVAWCRGALRGVDVDARAVRVAKALMVIAGGSGEGIRQGNSLLEADEEVVDVILTNPPFAGDVREEAVLSRYELVAARERAERDVLFVERCVKLLKPGGRMAMVLPHNKLAAKPHARLRTWLMERARVVAVVGLGRHTFLPHTHQKAGILVVQKHQGEVREEDPVTFLAISERDGKDSRGDLVLRERRRGELWERVDHDFDEILREFGQFSATNGLDAWR